MTITKHSNTYLILFVTLLISFSLQAQQANFIHIQSEANQPFAVQLKGQTYSSSATGYLVIPQVPVGEHTFVIGFAGNTFPEYSFQFTVADKPRGFSLKQGVDNGWTLFDMVDFTVIRGAIPIKETVKAAELKVPEPVIEKKADSAVLNTSEHAGEKNTKPTVSANNPSINPEIPKATGAVSTAAVTGVIGATAVTGAIVSKSKPATNTKQSTIQKIFDKASNSGIDQVYIVVNNGKADTVALFIPVIKEELKQGAINQGGLPGRKASIPEITGMLLIRPNRLQIHSK